MDRRLIPLEVGMNKILVWKEFVTSYLEAEKPVELINLAYACAHLDDSLYGKILDLNRNPIKNISWEGYWEDE